MFFLCFWSKILKINNIAKTILIIIKIKDLSEKKQ
jgi:hypothetical protein